MRRCRGGLNGDCSALNFSGCDKSATTTTKTTLFVFLAVAVATIKAPIFYCLCSTNLRGPSPNRKSAFSNSLPFPLYPLQKLCFFLPFPPFLPPPLCKIDSLLVKCFYPTATHPPQHTQQRSLRMERYTTMEWSGGGKRSSKGVERGAAPTLSFPLFHPASFPLNQ